MDTLETIINMLSQISDEQELDQIQHAIGNRRNELEHERQPHVEFESMVSLVNSWYRDGSHNGLWYLLAMLAEQGIAVVVTPLFGSGRGYHAEIHRILEDRISLIGEALTSHDPFGAFEGSDRVDAVARALAHCVQENDSGLNVWDWRDTINPNGCAREDAFFTIPGTSGSYTARVTFDGTGGEETREVEVPFHNDYLAKIEAFNAGDYSPEIESLEPADLDVEWL